MQLEVGVLSPPASTLIARFRPLQGGVGSPVHPHPNRAYKHLILLDLSRIIRTNLSAVSIIHPVFRLLQGSALSRAARRSGGHGRERARLD